MSLHSLPAAMMIALSASQAPAVPQIPAAGLGAAVQAAVAAVSADRDGARRRGRWIAAEGGDGAVWVDATAPANGYAVMVAANGRDACVSAVRSDAAKSGSVAVNGRRVAPGGLNAACDRRLFPVGLRIEVGPGVPAAAKAKARR